MFLKKKALMEDALEGEEFFEAQEYASSAANKEVNDILKAAEPETKKAAANVAAAAANWPDDEIELSDEEILAGGNDGHEEAPIDAAEEVASGGHFVPPSRGADPIVAFAKKHSLYAGV